MKKYLLHLLPIAITLLTALSIFGQDGDRFWKPITTANRGAVVKENKRDLTKLNLFELNIGVLKSVLVGSPKRAAGFVISNTIISFPDADGKLENYSVFENSNMDPALAARYPDIKSYIGKGIEDPTALIYFSVSPLGLQTMLLKANNESVFIEPFTKDLKSYAVYRKSDRPKSPYKFECYTIDQVTKKTSANRAANRPNADDGKLRTMRFAVSANGEYTAYWGGTVAAAVAAINNTVTRINGIFETDLGVHFNLVANNDAIIFTDAATDPYTDDPHLPGNEWTDQVQAVMNSYIGSANYDVGHMLAVGGGGGNGGCLGCVCEDANKGSGWSSLLPDRADFFDVEIVGHEMGHQFGANHTFTFLDEGTIVQVEVGAGATIMSYAGYGTPGVDDYLPAPYAYFHAVSIQQITDIIKAKSCPVLTPTGNAVPTANAGADYTIPKGTPFALKGTATDANDAGLTYNWEQMDPGTTATKIPDVNATTGPAFRNFNVSANRVRYFPELPTILAGATSSQFEAVPNVSRTLNFRFTVRDNHPGGPANNSDDMVVTVDGSKGPFFITSNLSGSYSGGSSQTVTWSVNGTNTSTPYVKVSLSTDGGNTFPTVLLASTSNDGSQSVTLPNVVTTTARIKVEAVGNIFFDISDNNFSINACTAPAMPGTISGKTSNLCGGGYFTYSIEPVPGATSYIWSVSGNSACTISGSTTSTTVTIRLASYFYGKVTLSVKAKNSCGTSQPRTVILTDEPAAPASISGPSTVTKYQSNLVYEVPYTAGLSYHWSVNGGTITSKPVPNRIVVKWGRYSGTVSVKLGNKCGYSAWTTKNINVSSGSNNHEEMGQPITEKTQLKSYPNPVSDRATIEFYSETMDKKFTMEVRDVSGKLINTESGRAVKGINIRQLDVSGYAASMYIVILKLDGEKHRSLKLLKAK